ncbi:MAG: hypothetical protein EG828_05480 [Deltaproteobacteria bacterium]|nr:hypothetical protein [Deltaproteobacteria bacterium]
MTGAGAGAGDGAAVTGAGAGVEESAESDTVLREEAGTGTIVEPIADTGTGFSVDAGAEPRFANGVAADLAAVDRFTFRDDPSLSSSCSLSVAPLSESPLPRASECLPIFPCSDFRCDESVLATPSPFPANAAVGIMAAQATIARIAKILLDCFMITTPLVGLCGAAGKAVCGGIPRWNRGALDGLRCLVADMG